MSSSQDYPGQDDNPIGKPDLHELIQAIHERARRIYEASGAPFGPSEAGLELWLVFGQDTTSN